MKKEKINSKKFVPSLISKLYDSLSSFTQILHDKCRLAGRIRLLNQWGAKNPKKVTAFFLISMIVIIGGDLLVSSLIKQKQQNSLTTILSVDPIFNGMNQIQNNQENIKLFYSKMVEDGALLTNQLDSINNLENKTQTDSVKMYKIINQLNVISKILTHEEN